MTGNEAWQPQYSPWRHGGWYVDNVRYPSGAVGCVSRNYADRKWRIACDDRPDAFERFTYPNRDAAARAEYELAQAAHAERLRTLAAKVYGIGHSDNRPNHRDASCAACGGGVRAGTGLEVLGVARCFTVYLHNTCAARVAEAQAQRRERAA